jgi:phosphopantothenoylcysteine decarboxylase/phosphopantothenate--cysteine ligase
VDLRGKHIVLGVSGGIAAYKAVEVCRRLVDAGAFVSPVLTRGAQRFIGAATFSALASEPTRTELFDGPEPSPHTRLGQSADLVLVAPATAHLLSAYATGSSSDLLTATLLATRAPVMVCPAMHTEMWEHPAVQENVATLARRGTIIVPPTSGHLAGGDVGTGRLAEPADIVDAVRAHFGLTAADRPSGDLRGLRVLVTAGGTREPVDPVRFLGNRSSGKQGHALAAEAAARGADVVLVTTTDRPTPATAEVVHVETAEQMLLAVRSRAATCDVVVMAAAVADFRPVAAAPSKIKKATGVPELHLEPTTDILAELSADRAPGQTIVGFAAETDDVVAHATDKLARKGLDLIVANDVAAPHTGFAHDTNAVVILSATGGRTEVPLADKRQLAAAVLDEVVRLRTAAVESVAPAPHE